MTDRPVLEIDEAEILRGWDQWFAIVREFDYIEERPSDDQIILLYRLMTGLQKH